MTFPKIPLLGFSPRSPRPLGTGNWAIEVDLSIANAFQISDGAEDWLEGRGGRGKSLTIDDAARMIDETAGPQFYIDGEFGPSGLIDIPLLPSINAAFVKRLGGRTSAVIQGLVSRNVFEDADDSDIDGVGFQLTAGVTISALGG
jgi:hypothetical protein